MPATLIATNFEELRSLCRHPSNQGAAKIGENTIAKYTLGHVEIELHGHSIVKMRENRLYINLAGFPTNTTRARINAFLPEGYNLRSVSGKNILTSPGTKVGVPVKGWFRVL